VKLGGGHLSYLIGKDMSYLLQLKSDIKSVINAGYSNPDVIANELFTRSFAYARIVIGTIS